MTRPPATARAAVALWYALAAFGLLNAAYLWVRRGALDEAAARGGVAASTVTALLVQLTVAAVLFGAGYAVLARFLRLGRRWSRGALTALALAHVLWLVLTRTAGVNAVVLLLLAAGSALTWLRGTAQWVQQSQ
ncbi:hypothetical protein [Saccharothrix obliqua]|uniref:hypothetical protein n=1 Tax=Saccharothrix obliqua TaxID=2861747 RepID=UPI001C5F9404|nr:hypothetical protein [Saccharothrix obliqua]MBW4715851.1 hypothetical protein [Saccharothrix obliqua]